MLNWIGRGRGGGYSAGPGGQCVCPACGTTVAHQVGVQCYLVRCPKCGSKMTRDFSNTFWGAGLSTAPLPPPPPLGPDRETDNIIIKGVIYKSDGITTVPNAEVIVKNETQDITYGVTSTDDSGAYDVRVFKGFGEFIAKTGDKISFTVNGIEEKNYILKDTDIVPPYIVTVDVLLIASENGENGKNGKWIWVAIALGAVFLLTGEDK